MGGAEAVELLKQRRVIGRNIRVLRKSQRLSLRELSERLHFSHTRLSSIERGEVSASKKDLENIAHELHVSLNELRHLHTERLDALKEIQTILSENGDLRRAKELAEQFLSERIFPEDEATAHELLGMIHFKLGNYKISAEHWKLVYDLNCQFGEYTKVFKSLDQLARIHWMLQDLDKSHDYLVVQLDYVMCDEDTMKVKSNLALLEVERHSYEKAYNLYMEVLPFYEEQKDSTRLARLYHNLADVLKKRGTPSKAVEYYQKAYKYEKELKMFSELAKTAEDLASIYLSEEKKEEAADILASTYTEVEPYLALPDQATMKFLYSRCLDGAPRKKLLEDCFLILRETDHPLRRKVAAILGDLAEQEGNTKAALEYFKCAVRDHLEKVEVG